MDQASSNNGGGYQRPTPGPGEWGVASPMCVTVEPLLYGFRTQTLDRERMLMVAQHVSTCATCSARLRQVDASLRGAQLSHQPPQSASAPGRVSTWDQPFGAQDPSAAFRPEPFSGQADQYPPSLGPAAPAQWPSREGTHWPLGAPASGPRASALRKPLPEFLRPPLVWFTGTAALCGLLALTFILISLPLLIAPGTSTRPHVTATRPAATATTVPLPAFSLPVFSDWRAAYIAADGKVHIVSLDGTSDITGPALNLIGADTRGGIGLFQGHGGLLQAVAVSPDGHTLAYINEAPPASGAGVAPPVGPIVLVPLAGGESDRVITATAGDLFWSPDGTQLAYDSVSGLFVVSVANASSSPQLLAPKTPVGNAQVLGWIDGSHLALLSTQDASMFTPIPTPTAAPTATAAPSVTASPSASPSGSTGATSPVASTSSNAHTAPLTSLLSAPKPAVVTLNVQTGDTNLVVAVGPSQTASLSPDGKAILLSSSGGCSPGPCAGPTSGNAALVDTTTGQIHPLADSTTLLPPSGMFFWSPDSFSIAQTIPNKDTQPDSWLVNVVDLEQAAGATLRTGVFALGWSPDGKTIIVGDVSTLGEGKVQAFVILTASPSTAPVVLPGKVTEFLGFVRTA